ncbi:MAG: hypothetical protein K2U26_12935 [Cyclobacteriaceae bacterium]|nr:hypothetical protein [Cyclobacteriaceae bacterium]
MRTRLTILITIFLLALSAMPINAESEIIQGQAQQLKFSNSYPDKASHKSVGLRQITNNRTTEPTNSEHESRIGEFQEAFTNAPVIELSESFFNLIEEVYQQTKNCSYRKSDYPNQGTLFNILFQVIISPNAP